MSAYQRGWSVRNGPTATAIPVWLSRLREQGWPTSPSADPAQPAKILLREWLAEEVTALRQCHSWLEQAERGERVVVNLCPDTDAVTECVLFDRLRILRVIERITANLDDLARPPHLVEPAAAPAADDPHLLPISAAEARRNPP